MQSCVPFTPATGARILLAPSAAAPAVRRALAQTLMTITGQAGPELACSASTDTNAGSVVSGINAVDDLEADVLESS